MLMGWDGSWRKAALSILVVSLVGVIDVVESSSVHAAVPFGRRDSRMPAGTAKGEGQCRLPLCKILHAPQTLSLRGGSGDKIKAINSKEEFDEAMKAAELCVCDFTAPWCGPCQKILPVFQTLSYEFGDISFLQVDVDANPDTSAACGISCMPTFQFYLKGKKIQELQGADETKLRTAIVGLRKALELQNHAAAVATAATAQKEELPEAEPVAPAPAT